MPFVNISLLEGKSPEYIKSIADGVQEALIYAFKIPDNDRFQVITEHKKHLFIIDKTYMDIHRSDDVVIIYITLKEGRTREMKKNLYQRIMKNLHQNPGLRKEDIMVILVDNDLGNWSFGNGIAQLI